MRDMTTVPARPIATVEAFAQLGKSFPTLCCAPGLEPWDPGALDAWAATAPPSRAALYSARFVLAVWNSSATWQSGAFDVVAAFAAWDGVHRAAFMTWAQKPWWA